ncbi:HNH endonuclease [Cronobacter turicensis]
MNEINEYLAIDLESPSGLIWIKRASQRAKPGCPAFTATDSNGYYIGKFKGKMLKAHRVVYFLHNGEWPQGEVDHKDGNRKNNSPFNLRDVSKSINQQNQQLTKGFSLYKPSGKWVAKIRTPDGKQKHLGYFDNEHDASAAYLAAKSRFHEGWIKP